MADELSDQVRLLLQGGIQTVLRSFKTATFHEKEELNDLLTFYRAMHAMSLKAIGLERKLNVIAPRETDRLFREFGPTTDNRLPRPAAEENPDLRLAGRNASGNGVQEEIREPDETREGRVTYIVLDFGRP